ncbi:MAG: ribonuclease H-like domain-containing protein, partial [Desulfobacterales bacterium]|nr:ribonuclease H-like domain-containing protein [Desulfobacterales bacterium]
MLENTFIHVQGIGAKTEERLWSDGLLKWSHVDPSHPGKTARKKAGMLSLTIRESREQRRKGNPNYFENLLPAHLHWRFFPEFREETVYLDIETDGLDPYGGVITTIALYDGRSIKWYVNGRNLDDFLVDIQKYKVIVSYNGKTFDIPFIQEYFGVEIPHAHIDLRYILSSLGFKGGLKKCEIALGIDRGELKGVDGFFAVLLWSEYQRTGNEKALETLLAYNIEDVVNLETLMVKAYNMKIEDTPFAGTNRLSSPKPPRIPFSADLAIVDKLKG